MPRCQVLRGGEGQKSRNGRVNELDGAFESGGKGGFHRALNLGKVEIYEHCECVRKLSSMPNNPAVKAY